MERDAIAQRNGKQFVFTDAKHGEACAAIVNFLVEHGGL